MDELRDRYLQGKMSGAEQKAFEDELSSQEKKDLATELGIQAGLEYGFRNELRNKVTGFEARRSRAKKINPAYISIAASLFLVASLVLYFTRDQTSLFNQYYEVYPNYEITTVRGDESISSREKAYLAYDAGNYQKAIDIFSQLEALLPADYFFRGVSYIQVKEYQNALSDFEVVIDSEDKAYDNASVWYSALLFLKLENDKEAIPLLQSLSEGKSEFAIASKELLDKL